MGVDVLPPKPAAERATTMAALRCLMPVASEEEEEEEKKKKAGLRSGFAKPLCKDRFT